MSSWCKSLVLAMAVTGPLMSMEVEREHLGDRIFAQSGAWHDGVLHLTTVENMRFGHGQGENFTHWRRIDGENAWSRQPLFTEHHPGMTSLLPLGKEGTLFLYVDRKDESERSVHLVCVGDDGERRLFVYRGERGVLNPQMDRLPDGRLHLLVPDRTARHVRRFLVDLQSGQSERLPDVAMPREGARIYDRLVRDDLLLVPVSVVHEMLLLAIDLSDHSHSLHPVDSFTSASGEPPRMTSIFHLPDLSRYALIYMRPAAFSDRGGRRGPATGLLGEIVVNLVDDRTLQTTGSTTIAGFKAEEAATHNMAVAQLGPREFLLAHTEVDRIHQRHLSGAYENYVGGFVTRWQIDDTGEPICLAKHRLPPFFSTRLVGIADRTVALISNEARPGDPLHLYRIAVQVTD